MPMNVCDAPEGVKPGPPAGGGASDGRQATVITALPRE